MLSKIIRCSSDHALTAISVAKDCNIVDGDLPVFMAELSDDNERVQWTNVEDITTSLNLEDVEHDDDEADDQEISTQSPSDRSKANDYGRLGSASGSEESECSLLLEEPEFPWSNLNTDFSLAITGKAFQKIVNDHQEDPSNHGLRTVLRHCQIFARMSPDQKALLVESLQNEGLIVGMCGDGANDCCALKMADVGVSLSEAEASIAAPFTSQYNDISCIIRLLREGRAALTTSFQCFKYMALYSMIQYITVTILYSYGAELTDAQFLYIDLFSIMPLALFMSRTGPSKHLSVKQPSGALISVPILTSVLGQTVVQLIFQALTLYHLSRQDWYVKFNPDENKGADTAVAVSYEASALFLVSNIQYLATVLAFSEGKPFRKSFVTNPLFLASFVILLLGGLLLFFDAWPWFNAQIGIRWMPPEFRLSLFAITAASFAATILFEKIAVRYVAKVYSQRRTKKIHTKKGPKLLKHEYHNEIV